MATGLRTRSRRAIRAVVVLCAVAGVVMLGATPATASIPSVHGYGQVSTTGASAEAEGVSTQDTNGAWWGMDLYVCNTYQQNAAYNVYAHYTTNGGTANANTLWVLWAGVQSCALLEVHSVHELTFHVCRQIPNAADNCSGWLTVWRT